MIGRFIATAALAVSLPLVSGFAQTAAELLQKGIYTQETAGDLDGAIQIYRQVVGSASNQPAIAAQAQFRLTLSLLQKVDFAGVTREFEIMARNYPEQQDMVDAIAQRLRTIAENGPTQLLGNFQNGRYHHYWTGVELTVPTGWSFKNLMPQPDGYDRVDLADGTSKATSAFVVARRESSAVSPPVAEVEAARRMAAALAYHQQALGRAQPAPNTPPADIAAVLQQRLQAKRNNQRREADGYHAYAFRPDRIRPRVVGGQRALSAVADYMNGQGAMMNEYLMFVQSDKTRVFFSVHAAAADFPDVMARFEPIISTAVIP